MKENESTCVLPYKSDESVFMKAWNIGLQDKLTPISNYADSVDRDSDEGFVPFRNTCAARCRDTPGCFKFKLDGTDTCVLRGNNMENPTDASFGEIR